MWSLPPPPATSSTQPLIEKESSNGEPWIGADIYQRAVPSPVTVVIEMPVGLSGSLTEMGLGEPL